MASPEEILAALVNSSFSRQVIGALLSSTVLRRAGGGRPFPLLDTMTVLKETGRRREELRKLDSCRRSAQKSLRSPRAAEHAAAGRDAGLGGTAPPRLRQAGRRLLLLHHKTVGNS